MAYVIRPWDREWFKRCRRAWDLGSRTRQSYEPIKPLRMFDFDRAMHDALAVYYFPGMWDWSRTIVNPLALEAFRKSMRQQRDTHAAQQAPSAADERAWCDHLELGELMLGQYFEWAPTVDRFAAIRVETEFQVDVPDPSHPDEYLTTPGGEPIRYRGRIDLLVVDGASSYWLVDHRIAEDTWEDADQLRLDEQRRSYCWAWEDFFLGMKIAGVIYNELRIHPQLGDAERLRRTPLRRSPIELGHARTQIGLEALDMVSPLTRIYPNPSRHNCAMCAYLSPCLAMTAAAGADDVLQKRYRKRAEDAIDAGGPWTETAGNRAAQVPGFPLPARR